MNMRDCLPLSVLNTRAKQGKFRLCYGMAYVRNWSRIGRNFSWRDFHLLWNSGTPLSEMERLQNIAERYREQFQVLYDQEQTRRRLGEERLRLEGRLLWERERRENPHREVTLPEQTGIEISSGDPDPSATGGATGSQADFIPSPLEMYSFDPTLCSWILELPGIGITLTLLAVRGTCNELGSRAVRHFSGTHPTSQN